MKHSRVITAALVALLMSAAGAAAFDCDKRGYGANGPRGCGQGDGRMITGAVYELDLSDTQREAIEKLAVEHRYAMKPVWSGMQEELAETVTPKGLDREAFVRIEKERAAKRAELKAEYMEKVVALLTKEQREELKEKIKEEGFGPMGCKSRR